MMNDRRLLFVNMILAFGILISMFQGIILVQGGICNYYRGVQPWIGMMFVFLMLLILIDFIYFIDISTGMASKTTNYKKRWDTLKAESGYRKTIGFPGFVCKNPIDNVTLKELMERMEEREK